MPNAWVPKDGFKFNPLMSYPRNLPCPCGAKVKFKKCCLPKMGRVVKAEDHAALQTFVSTVKTQHANGVAKK